MLKKIILFIILFNCCGYLFSQIASSSLNLNNKKLLVGCSIAPKYSFRSLKSATGNGKIVVEARNKNELPMLAKSFGLVVDYFFSKKIGLGLGLSYSENAQQTQPTTIATVTPQGFGGGTEELYFVYKTNFIDIPLKLNYVIFDKKVVTLYTTLGIVNNIYFNQSTMLYKTNLSSNTTSKSKSASTVSVNPYSVSFLVAAGIDFNVKKIKIRLQPSYDRFLTSATNGDIKTYYYNVSLNLGIIYKFVL
jgi:hypothetical protein